MADNENIFPGQQEAINEFLYTHYRQHNNPDDNTQFVIPFIAMNDGHTPAQVKAVASGMYKDIQRSPFLRKTGVFNENSCIDDIDITPLVYYGTLQQSKIAPTLENIDVKLYYREPDLHKFPGNDGTYADKYVWRELPVGFSVYNNDTVYGYDWVVLQNSSAGTDGVYNLHMNIEDGLGVCKFAGSQAPITLAGVQFKIVITAKNLWNREYSLLDNFPVVRSLDSTNDSLPPSVSAVRDYYANALNTALVITQKLYAPNTDTPTLFADEHGVKITALQVGNIEDVETLINSIKENSESHLNEMVADAVTGAPHGINNSGFGGNINAHRLEGLGVSNGAQGGITGNITDLHAYIPFVDESNSIGFGTHFNIYRRAGNANPTLFFERGIDASNTTLTINDRSASAGLEDFLYTLAVGTTILNAKLESSGDNAKLTLTKGNSSEDKVTVKLNKLESNGLLFTGYPDLELTATVLQGLLGSSSIAYKIPLSESLPFDIKSQNANVVLIPNTSLDVQGFPADAFNSNQCEGRNLLVFPKKHENDRFVINAAVSGFDKLGSALQALHELPLGTFKYKSGQSEYKEQIGIFVERVNQVRDKLASMQEAGLVAHKRTSYIQSNNDKIFDYDVGLGAGDNSTDQGSDFTKRLANNEYTYTDDEIKSIAHYLDLTTGKKELQEEVRNVVNILIKAAQETQDRLLDVEASVFGFDAKSMPGDDEAKKAIVENGIEEELRPILNNSPLLLGLNRLIRAICLELYDTTDLEEINSETKAVVTDTDNLGDKLTIKSRLDQLDEILKESSNQISAIINYYKEHIHNDEASHVYTDILQPNGHARHIENTTAENAGGVNLLANVVDNHTDNADYDAGKEWKNLASAADLANKDNVGFATISTHVHKHTPTADESGIVRLPVTEIDERTGEPKLKIQISEDGSEVKPVYEAKAVAWDHAKLERVNKKLSEVTKAMFGVDDVVAKLPNRTEVMRRNITNLVDDLYPNRTFDVEKPRTINNVPDAEIRLPFKSSKSYTEGNSSPNAPARPTDYEYQSDEGSRTALEDTTINGVATAIEVPREVTDGLGVDTEHTSIIPYFDNALYNFKIVNNYLKYPTEAETLEAVNNKKECVLLEDPVDFIANKQISTSFDSGEITFDTSKLITDLILPSNNLDDQNQPIYGLYKNAYSSIDLLENLIGIEDCFPTNLFASHILDVIGIDQVSYLNYPAIIQSPASVANGVYNTIIGLKQEVIRAKCELVEDASPSNPVYVHYDNGDPTQDPPSGPIMVTDRGKIKKRLDNAIAAVNTEDRTYQTKVAEEQLARGIQSNKLQIESDYLEEANNCRHTIQTNQAEIASMRNRLIELNQEINIATADLATATENYNTKNQEYTDWNNRVTSVEPVSDPDTTVVIYDKEDQPFNVVRSNLKNLLDISADNRTAIDNTKIAVYQGALTPLTQTGGEVATKFAAAVAGKVVPPSSEYDGTFISADDWRVTNIEEAAVEIENIYATLQESTVGNYSISASNWATSGLYNALSANTNYAALVDSSVISIYKYVKLGEISDSSIISALNATLKNIVIVNATYSPGFYATLDDNSKKIDFWNTSLKKYLSHKTLSSAETSARSSATENWKTELTGRFNHAVSSGIEVWHEQGEGSKKTYSYTTYAATKTTNYPSGQTGSVTYSFSDGGYTSTSSSTTVSGSSSSPTLYTSTGGYYDGQANAVASAVRKVLQNFYDAHKNDLDIWESFKSCVESRQWGNYVTGLPSSVTWDNSSKTLKSSGNRSAGGSNTTTTTVTYEVWESTNTTTGEGTKKSVTETVTSTETSNGDIYYYAKYTFPNTINGMIGNAAFENGKAGMVDTYKSAARYVNLDYIINNVVLSKENALTTRQATYADFLDAINTAQDGVTVNVETSYILYNEAVINRNNAQQEAADALAAKQAQETRLNSATTEKGQLEGSVQSKEATIAENQARLVELAGSAEDDEATAATRLIARATADRQLADEALAEAIRARQLQLIIKQNAETELLAATNQLNNTAQQIHTLSARVSNLEQLIPVDTRTLNLLPSYAAELQYEDLQQRLTAGVISPVIKTGDTMLQTASNLEYVLSRKQKSLQARITTLEAFADEISKAFNMMEMITEYSDAAGPTEIAALDSTLIANKRFEEKDAIQTMKTLAGVSKSNTSENTIFDLDLSESFEGFEAHNRDVWKIVCNSRKTRKTSNFTNPELEESYYTLAGQLVIAPALIRFEEENTNIGNYYTTWGPDWTITVRYVNSAPDSLEDPENYYKSIYLKKKTVTSNLGKLYDTADATDADIGSVLGENAGFQNQTEYNIYKTINNLFTSLFTRNTTESKDNLYYQMMLLAHPVGSIYASMDPTSPEELFGGTWEQIKDRFILAAGDTTSADNTGGNSQITLSTANVPLQQHTHGHTFQIASTSDLAGKTAIRDVNGEHKAIFEETTNRIWQTSRGGGTSGNGLGQTIGWGYEYNTFHYDFNHSHSLSGEILSTPAPGEPTPIDTTPPYMSAYVWKRIH